MRKAEGVKQKMKIKLSAAAPAALLDYLLQNAGSTWLARCQDLANCPRVAGPLGPSRISIIDTIYDDFSDVGYLNKNACLETVRLLIINFATAFVAAVDATRRQYDLTKPPDQYPRRRSSRSRTGGGHTLG